MLKHFSSVIIFWIFILGVLHAQSPDPYAPARGTLRSTQTFVLKWNHGPLSANVDVLIDTNSNFSTAQVFSNISADSLVFTANSQKKYYWKISYTGSSDFSSVYDFRYYTPLSAGGLKGWFSALNISQANNTALTNWNSLETGSPATNANSAQSPVYHASGGLANKPMVTFRPPYQKLNTQITGAEISNTDPISFYFLGKLNNQSQSYGFIFSQANFTTYTPNQHNRAAYNYNGAANFLWASNGPAGSAQYFISTAANSWRTITAVDNTEQAKLYRNSQHIGTNASSVYSIHPSSPVILGGYVDNAASGVLATANMDVSEMLFFNTEHPDSIRNLIERLLVQRYIPPVNLGKDTSVNPLCGSLALNAGAGYASYHWSTGATSQILNITSPGTYWVEVNDGFGNIYSDTINVSSQSSFNQPASTIFVCNGGQYIWQSNLSNSVYDFLWSDGSTDSALTINSAGFYYVTITETLTGCSFKSDTVEVVMDNFPLASLGNDTTLCLNNDLYLNMDAGFPSSFLWSTGATTESINITTAGTYWVQATNENGCYASDTINVLVSGIAPDIDFTVENRCEGSMTSFSASSNMNPLSFNWQFGDGNQAFLAQSNNQYAQPGVYKVSLYILADNGCGNLIKKDIRINSRPQINFSYTDTCLFDSVRFYGNVLPISGGIQSIQWINSDPYSNDLDNAITLTASHQFQQVGPYDITLIATNDSGCVNQEQKTIQIKGAAYPDFTATGECFKAPTIFNSTSTFSPNISPTSYTWFFGNNTSSSLFSPQVIYNNPDSYQVTLRITSNNGCKSYRTKTIYVNKGVEAEFIMADSVCEGAIIPLENQSYGINDPIFNYTWKFGSSFTSNLENPSFAFTQAGTRIVQLFVETENGCKDSTQQSIVVLASPVATFTVNNPVGEAPLEVTPIFTGSNAQYYTWDFGNGEQTNAQNPGTITYDSVGNYTLTLISEANTGCRDTHSVTIEVRDLRLDAEWLQVSCVQVDGMLRFSGNILNLGNILIENLELGASLNYEDSFIEKWIGNIPVNATKQIELNAKIQVNDYNTPKFCCLDVVKINDQWITEDRRKCVAIEKEFWLSNIYPNPADGDIHLEFILKDEESIEISIFDMSGKKVLSKIIEGQKGINSFNTSTESLRKGMYFVKIKDEVRKFIL